MSDIVEVINHYIEVSPVGDKYKALCPFHNEKTPSLTIFPETNSWYCFGACAEGGDAVDFVQKHEDIGFKEAKKTVEEILGHEVDVGSGGEKKRSEAKSVAVKPMPKEAIKEFQKDKVFQDLNYRGIRKETDEYFRVLSKVEDGQVVARYYPETREGKLVGYKCRNHPKDFTYGKVGHTGTSNDLAGQFRHKSGGKYVLYTAGEEDLLAAHQMLRDHQIQRNQEDFAPIPVVSPTSGEGSAAKQAAAQYDWFDQFDNIIIGMDNDPAGHKAAKAVAEVLPKEKVKIVTWFNKDPNQMLMQGQSSQFIRDFYNSKEYVKTGIKSSKDADAEMESELGREKIPLPPFMSKLQELMAGGIPLGYIVCIIAKSGIGKTSIINEMLYYWIFNSPYKMGILSLELNAGQYNLAMLSRHIGRKIQLIKDPKEAVEFINSPEVLKKRKELVENEYGEPSWMLLDDRDGTIDTIIKKCEILIKKHSCKILVVDPLQDVIEACSYEDRLKFIKWQKTVVKDGITFINITHVRKGNTSTDKEGKRINRELTEDDVHGMSEIIKSSGANIIVDRDKYAEDVIDRNTTKVVMSKCRWTGYTGNAGEWYYDVQSHTMYDKETYFSGNHEENN